MKGFNRPQKGQGRDLFYQTPTNCSNEEIQRYNEFLKKLQEADDKTLYPQYVGMMQRYVSGNVTYIQLKGELVMLLSKHTVLCKEFSQLFLYFASPLRNHSKKEDPKAELERTVAFLRKVESLGDSVYKAFMDAIGFRGDNEILIEKLGKMLRGHESLKEEFETFLIDNRLLKRKRDCVDVTPSYSIRPGVEKGSSSAAVLHGEYYSVGSYAPEKNSEACRDEKFHEMLLHDLDSFIEFGKVTNNASGKRKRGEKQPVGLSRVLEWICNGKKVYTRY